MPPVPEYLNLPFLEAIAAFRRKVTIPTETWRDFAGEGQDWAFTIAGLTQADLLEDIQGLVDDAISEGQATDNFVDQFMDLIQGTGWVASEKRARTILQENNRSAQRSGRYEQSNTPAVRNYRPWRMWKHRTSPLGVPRPLHQELDGQVFPADHEFWLTAFPPCGFGCRCTVFNLSDRDLVRMNKTPGVPPDPRTIADPGWDYTPGVSGAAQRSTIIQNRLQNLSPALRAQVEGDLRDRGLLD
jgi:uncharacterized protein with gpF-like domain